MAALTEKIHQSWKKLVESLDQKKSAEAELLRLMNQEYVEEIQIAADLKESADKIPYDHLRQKLIDIAEAEERHAALLREKILELGGEPPERDTDPRDESRSRRKTFEQLLRDLEEEKEDYVSFLKASFRAEDAGRPDVKELFDQIREEERQHREELIDVLTRLNPLPK